MYHGKSQIKVNVLDAQPFCYTLPTMKQQCYWGDPNFNGYSSLEHDIKTDALIVGAGVAGLFAAYHLLEQGVEDIVIVESKTVGSGSTGRSAGMLTCECETATWTELIQKYGVAHARSYFDAQQRALNCVAKVVKGNGLSCDFALRDYYLVSGKDGNQARVLSEFHSFRQLGGSPLWLEGEHFSQELDTPLYASGERMLQGISVDPMRFMQEMSRYLSSRKVRIFEHSMLEDAAENSARVNGHTVSFSKIIYAQGTSYSQADAENYITTIGLTAPLPFATLQLLALDDKDMFADMLEPSFFYGKVTGENRLMIGYGDTVVETSDAESELYLPHYETLRDYLYHLCPTESLEFEFAWSGVFSLSKQMLPVVKIEHNKAVIAGVGSQVASIALAEYAVHQLIHGTHPLELLFQEDTQSAQGVLENSLT